jgi:hypothetical protein
MMEPTSIAARYAPWTCCRKWKGVTATLRPDRVAKRLDGCGEPIRGEREIIAEEAEIIRRTA